MDCTMIEGFGRMVVLGERVERRYCFTKGVLQLPLSLVMRST